MNERTQGVMYIVKGS